MNEASNFCPYPCKNPAKFAKENGNPPTPPPVRENPRPLPGFPEDFQPPKQKREDRKGKKLGLPDRDLINPKYKIANEPGSISNKTIGTDLIHAGEGYAEYDTHNLYGTSKHTRLSFRTYSNGHSDEHCLPHCNGETSSQGQTIGYYTQHICRRRDWRCTLVCRLLSSSRSILTKLGLVTTSANGTNTASQSHKCSRSPPCSKSLWSDPTSVASAETRPRNSARAGPRWGRSTPSTAITTSSAPSARNFTAGIKSPSRLKRQSTSATVS